MDFKYFFPPKHLSHSTCSPGSARVRTTTLCGDVGKKNDPRPVTLRVPAAYDGRLPGKWKARIAGGRRAAMAQPGGVVERAKRFR